LSTIVNHTSGVYTEQNISLYHQELLLHVDLADYLADKVHQGSLRSVAEETGLSHNAINRIAQRKLKQLPELETLRAISAAYNLPLWKVIEMAGVDLELPATPHDEAAQLVSLLERMPTLRAIVKKIAGLSATRIKPILDMLTAYLKVEEQPERTELSAETQAIIAPLMETPEGQAALRAAVDRLLKEREGAD
jgi:transcriptional regulator with XRE-family HTH domain